ncbi:MAG: alanine racemase, partial [Desulfobacteraceae bacterium]
EGVYTHFASADSRSEFDQAYTRQQIDRFEQVCATLLQKGIDPGIRHAANSAGIIEYKRAHLDMVRAGISLYGLYPSGDIDPGSIALMPAMSLEATITSVREVPKGFKVSYGMTYETKKATRLASVPAGYADGYSRLLSSKGKMLVHGKRAPICGRVCMDQTLIDVGHIQGVKPGDTATLIGTQNGESVTADDLARLTRTINYEVVSSLTSRVGRVYSGRDDSGPDCA